MKVSKDLNSDLRRGGVIAITLMPNTDWAQVKRGV